MRISIANYETMLSNAIRRAVMLNEKMAVPRISDLPHIYSSTASKIEMEGFEEAREGKIINDLIRKACHNVFNRHYRTGELEELVAQFSGGFSVEASDMIPAKAYVRNAKEIIGLLEVVKKVSDSERPEMIASAMEFILEGLHVNKRLNKAKQDGKTIYRS